MRKPLDDDDGGAATKKVTKPGRGTGRNLGRGVIIASVILSLAWLFSSATQPRYILVPVETNENTFMYRLDQRMGAVHFCTTQQCVELPIREHAP
jgi:hypothetical protein